MNPYRVLGIPADASMDEIKRAYHRLVLTCHPDKGGTGFEQVQAAYDQLRCPMSRMALDRKVVIHETVDIEDMGYYDEGMDATLSCDSI